ncbi:hypothetical protein QZH41_010929 [Actinostola sp. cb2023]|nr:hypothetical protein QZH41_010929 [Actinostola sp. cb2023]
MAPYKRQTASFLPIRWRVVMLTLKGLGVKEISDRLLVGKTFVKKVRLFYQQTGSVAYDETNNRGKSRSLTAWEQLVIRRIIEQNPGLYLDEIAEWFYSMIGHQIKTPTLHKYLLRMGLSRKKLHVIANQRSEERRAEYRRKIADYHPDQLLFIDESSKDDRTFQRQYAWDLKGHKISRKGNFTRGTRFSVLCAISSKQTEMAHVIEGPFNSRQFEYAVEHFLVPHLLDQQHTKSHVLL